MKRERCNKKALYVPDIKDQGGVSRRVCDVIAISLFLSVSVTLSSHTLTTTQEGCCASHYPSASNN